MNMEAVIQGEGDDPKYAVIKHRLPYGGVMVLCQRCGKEWHPANPYFVNDFGRVENKPADTGWAEAVRFPTDNTASGSSLFQFQTVSM